MGSFYTSHTLRGPSQAQVLEWLHDRPAFVSATENAITTVLDEACESQDGEVLADLGARLSAHFACPVLAVLNHDDDLLYFELYEGGKKTDQYNSSPGFGDDDADDDIAAPSGGNAARLAAAFGGDEGAVESALRRTDFIFAMDRHAELASALGIPGFAVGVGYNYAAAGDLPPFVPHATYVLSNQGQN